MKFDLILVFRSFLRSFCPFRRFSKRFFSAKFQNFWMVFAFVMVRITVRSVEINVAKYTHNSLLITKARNDQEVFRDNDLLLWSLDYRLLIDLMNFEQCVQYSRGTKRDCA